MTREEALQAIKEKMDYYERDKQLRGAIETLIPELSGESKDEKTRKGLIEVVSDIAGGWPFEEHGITKKEALAYLEKQKEQKPVLYTPLCNTIKDKIQEYVANHFVTDTVVNTDVKSIVKAMEEGVRLGKEFQKSVEIDERKIINKHITEDSLSSDVNSRLKECGWYVTEQKSAEWSEEDKKQFNIVLDSLKYAYEDLNNNKSFDTANVVKKAFDWMQYCFKSIHPQKLDASKFENFDPVDVLNRIKNEWPMAWEKVVGKQEWSEEDEKRIKQLIYDTEAIRAGYEMKKKQLGKCFNETLIKDCDEQIAWLKSLSSNLKKRNEDIAKLCSNEWSEEDKKKISKLKTFITQEWFNKENQRKALDMIDALSPQPKQEWSEEDENKFYQVMEILLADKTIALQENPCCKALHRAFDELLDWLKSLPERFSLQPKQELGKGDL